MNIQNEIEQILKDVKVNREPFFEIIREYNQTAGAQLRGNLKNYLKAYNATMGSTSESAVTKAYLKTRNGVINSLDLSDEEMSQITKGGKKRIVERIYLDENKNPIRSEVVKLNEEAKNLKAGVQKLADGGYVEIKESFKSIDSVAAAKELLIERLSDFAQETKDLQGVQYKMKLQKFFPEIMESEIKTAMDFLSDSENIRKINPEIKTKNKRLLNILTKSVMGEPDGKNGIYNSLIKFKNNKNISYEAMQSKTLICMNFERSLVSGKFKEALEQAGLISDAKTYKDWINSARDILYDCNVSKDACKGNLHNSKEFKDLKAILFNENNFSLEKEIIPNIGKIVKDMINLGGPKEIYLSDDYLKSSSLAESIKTGVTMLNNDKNWRKMAGTMAIIITAATLLIQPLFGNVKKEFPDKKKEEEGKGGVA